jgi:5-(carboxyamino)imidazole ribonucleotide mutase
MPKVSIIMGSKSDLPVAEKATVILNRFSVAFDIAVASAHRTPKRVEELVKGSDSDLFIVIAGLSAALPGSVAALTCKPVIGVPVSGQLNMDAILSIVQMPPGIPVACVGLDRGDNAAILAVEMLGMSNPHLKKAIAAYRKEMVEKIIADSEKVRSDVGC